MVYAVGADRVCANCGNCIGVELVSGNHAQISRPIEGSAGRSQCAEGKREASQDKGFLHITVGLFKRSWLEFEWVMCAEDVPALALIFPQMVLCFTVGTVISKHTAHEIRVLEGAAFVRDKAVWMPRTVIRK